MSPPASQPGRLDGLVAIVTGGSSGIGRAIALAIAAEGARLVVIADIKHEPTAPSASPEGADATVPPTDEAIQTLHGDGRAVFFRCDVSMERATTSQGDAAQPMLGVADVVEKAAALAGRVDLIVNNAGGGSVDVPIHEQDYGEFNWSIGINLGGAFLGTKHALRQFLRQEPDANGFRGNIINISSIGAHVGLMASGTYCAAKGAILSLTKEVAIEYASKQIRCNAILPGYVQTRLIMPYVDTMPEFASYLNRSIAMGRLAQPEEMAPLAVYLASGRESSYVTGSEFTVDGGFTAR